MEQVRRDAVCDNSRLHGLLDHKDATNVGDQCHQYRGGVAVSSTQLKQVSVFITPPLHCP